eukprot:TRINITY_DN36352_c0_g1_i1.p1 TRINITY_DN36352_c0_g1~~TRINITY_DN36352_c0_g1_i1.p1  ORF type:complete len:165 (+),score=19.70 TRINITY_DN36352_c0_g1_i1:37-531(+)
MACAHRWPSQVFSPRLWIVVSSFVAIGHWRTFVSVPSGDGLCSWPHHARHGIGCTALRLARYPIAGVRATGEPETAEEKEAARLREKFIERENLDKRRDEFLASADSTEEEMANRRTKFLQTREKFRDKAVLEAKAFNFAEIALFIGVIVLVSSWAYRTITATS